MKKVIFSEISEKLADCKGLNNKKCEFLNFSPNTSEVVTLDEANEKWQTENQNSFINMELQGQKFGKIWPQIAPRPILRGGLQG
jgi:hypothetical protein